MAIHTDAQRACALEIAMAKHAKRQVEFSQSLWSELESRGLVIRVKSRSGDSWFELTSQGCQALRMGGGSAYGSGTCFSCKQRYSYTLEKEWFDTICPMCGFHADDE